MGFGCWEVSVGCCVSVWRETGVGWEDAVADCDVEVGVFIEVQGRISKRCRG